MKKFFKFAACAAIAVVCNSCVWIDYGVGIPIYSFSTHVTPTYRVPSWHCYSYRPYQVRSYSYYRGPHCRTFYRRHY